MRTATATEVVEMRDVGHVALAILVVLTVGFAGAPLAAAQDGTPTPTPTGNATATATPTPIPTTTPNGSPTTPNESGPVGTASQVRINPVKFQADYLNVVVAEEDATFNTTGEFAVFSLSHRVDAARIRQQPASVRVLEGGQTIKVEFQPDAAPPGEQSLYNVELFFEDGSSKTIQLYARQTDQSVAAARLQEWEPVINELCEFAEGHGYECTPEQVEAYLTWVNDRADLVDGFLTELAVRTLLWIVSGVTNPVVDILALILVAGAAAYRQRKHGDLLEALQRMAGRYEAKIDRLQLDHERAKRTADDDDLADVPAIGSTWATYWEDAYGVKSPLQLARLAAAGEERTTQDGLKRVHDGVFDDAFQPGEFQNSWLERVLRHVDREKIALNHLLRTFEWVEAEHNLGHHFRDARNRVEDVLTEVEQREEYPTNNSSSGFGGGPAQGDD